MGVLSEQEVDEYHAAITEMEQDYPEGLEGEQAHEYTALVESFCTKMDRRLSEDLPDLSRNMPSNKWHTFLSEGNYDEARDLINEAAEFEVTN